MKHLFIKKLSFLLIFLSFVVVLSRNSITSQNSEEFYTAETDEFIPPEVSKGEAAIEINLPATRLEFYLSGKLQKIYPIAIGMDIFPTPIRNFYISQIIWNPWWIPPDSEWAVNDRPTPPGPENPLGPVKMLLQNGVRIHGTSQPNSIGNAASHSCIRMYSQDAMELAWEIQKRYSNQSNPKFLETYEAKSDQTFYVGLSRSVPVYIKYKQVEVEGDKLFVHPDPYKRGGLQRELEVALAGYSKVSVNDALIDKLNEMREAGTVEVKINELGRLTEKRSKWGRSENHEDKRVKRF